MTPVYYVPLCWMSSVHFWVVFGGKVTIHRRDGGSQQSGHTPKSLYQVAKKGVILRTRHDPREP